MTYYLYHIPGVKVGVTTDLEERVHKQQGYYPGEYEIIETSEDIDFISKGEIIMQKCYGYKIDEVPYNKLKFNKMKINVTEMTTTFPCPINKLKGRLIDNMGMSWETPFGNCIITEKSIQWIMDNVKSSQYTETRCYVYNKAFANWFANPELFGEMEEEPKLLPRVKCAKKPLKMFEDIRDWARTRGLYEKGDAKTQYVKLQEEAGELAKALLENDKAEVIDAIGDMVVVLTNLAHLNGVHIETCINTAYKEISKRKGKMINGTFVKDE